MGLHLFFLHWNVRRGALGGFNATNYTGVPAVWLSARGPDITVPIWLAYDMWRWNNISQLGNVQYFEKTSASCLYYLVICISFGWFEVMCVLYNVGKYELIIDISGLFWLYYWLTIPEMHKSCRYCCSEEPTIIWEGVYIAPIKMGMICRCGWFIVGPEVAHQ